MSIQDALPSVPNTPVRIDRWLWAARFYKTRHLATEAVKSGHIQLRGVRAKASKPVHIGDEISIQKTNQVFELRVTGLAEKRSSASLAQMLYEETAASVRQRTMQAEQRKLKAASAPAPDKRPDKRARRHIIRFKSK